MAHLGARAVIDVAKAVEFEDFYRLVETALTEAAARESPPESTVSPNCDMV